MTSKFHNENIYALEKLESLNVKLLRFPDDVIKNAKIALNEVIDEQSLKNDDFKRVYKSIESYLKLSKKWSDTSLGYYLNIR
jgi:TRAP-type mannitol/chloroaromatic compound transport system substrate-binding protein